MHQERKISDLNIDTWERKEHYLFYKVFDEPYFGVTLNIDCTKAYAHCKAKNISFFLYYLHKSIVAANRIENFRYRIQNDKVIIYDKIHASSTINRPNGTFGFSYIQFSEDFEIFVKSGHEEIARVRNSSGLEPGFSGQDVIHYSSLPWLKFTSISHARNLAINDSCPKISFGKMEEVNGKKEMPISIHVHHALVDGIHVAQFVGEFQKLMNEK